MNTKMIMVNYNIKHYDLLGNDADNFPQNEREFRDMFDIPIEFELD